MFHYLVSVRKMKSFFDKYHPNLYLGKMEPDLRKALGLFSMIVCLNVWYFLLLVIIIILVLKIQLMDITIV